MSVFQRLRQVPIGDILHRGLLYTLVGITGWGVYMIGAVHMDTMRRGREALALKEANEANEANRARGREEAAKELALAQAAAQQAASRRT
ncbi:uncharacterized protein PHACADRAFT_260096 [Phanerochaete carnosa HHB-10118-sp]|uniref:Uncharacterized protein n=1 Tax=Phanerochaete carnosa (strain HHB-10118-sp) TaxID=650164 RepID=K5WT74_PHACS|nr:uncharacterized protein PHACADRAFT_260096 [Phanerochaete carnosa HHB-10118-sp]EKM53637.1 hypothetical protein PHACADRAFT_260096 [Phanerochaete carnosa HHB-10118-sp]